MSKYYKIELHEHKKDHSASIANIFRGRYKESQDWVKSDLPLRIYDGKKVVAEIDSWSRLQGIPPIKNTIQKNSIDHLWLPFGIIVDKGRGKLYDNRFNSWSLGIIPVTKIKEKNTGMFSYKESRYGVYRYGKKGKYKVYFNVDDHTHNQLSTTGCVKNSVNECHDFAKRIIDIISISNGQQKVEAIKLAASLIKEGMNER